jgi:hypothetical protein
MRIDEHALSVIEQLKMATNDSEVEAIILSAIESTIDKKLFSDTLQTLIGEISPLDCNSLQWSNLRFALICLRKQTITNYELQITNDHNL